MAEIKFHIERSIAVLSTTEAGWTTELNLVKWGDREPTYDIRSWSPDHSKMGKGKSLNREEIEALSRALKLELCRKGGASKSSIFEREVTS